MVEQWAWQKKTKRKEKENWKHIIRETVELQCPVKSSNSLKVQKLFLKHRVSIQSFRHRQSSIGKDGKKYNKAETYTQKLKRIYSL